MKTAQYVASILVLTAILTASAPGKKTQSERRTALSPEEQLTKFRLKEGFIIELIASEKDGIINPIDITFDDAGRLWTQTARMYPLDPVTGIRFGAAMKMMLDEKLLAKDKRFTEVKKLYTLEERGEDKILVLDQFANPEDLTVRTWAEGLAIPQSVMPYKDGCYVAHGSELFFMRDADGDGQQDAVEPVLSGFGFFDTHTMSHSIVRAPGGWFNFSHGAINSGNVKIVKTGETLNVTYCKNLRFSADGSKLEILNCGKDNVWGYQVRANGQWYATSANDNGYSVLPMEDQTSINGIGGDTIRPYQPYFPPVHKFRVGGSGISGLAFSEDGSKGFPKEWKDVALLANSITGTLNSVRIVRNADGSITADHIEDLLVCDDDWFRPVNIEFGPDGCLYIADWYNKIVSHNEVSTDHPDRDRKHGRIWRVRHESQTPGTLPNLITTPNEALVKHLSADILWERRAAWHQIVDRQAKEVVPQLSKLVLESKDDPITQIHALWCLEGLQAINLDLVKTLLGSPNADVRRETVRSLPSFGVKGPQVVSYLKPLINDENCMVRSQVLRTLDELNSADESVIDLLVTACKPTAPNDRLGGNYERNFERFLARKALEKYVPELKAYLSSSAAAAQDPNNLLWALQVLPAKERTTSFVSMWEQAAKEQIDDNTFVTITHMLNDSEVRKAVSPSFTSNPDGMLQQAIRLEDRINGPAVAQFYQAAIEKQLNSSDASTVKKGLNTITRLGTKEHTKTLIKMLQSKPDAALVPEILKALGNNPKSPVNVYRTVLNREELSFPVRLSALAAIAVKDPKGAINDAKSWLPSLSESDINALVSRLSYTAGGTATLLRLYTEKLITIESWDHYAAVRAKISHKKSKVMTQILKATEKRHRQEEDARAEKVEHYIAATQKLKGNPDVGQALFSMCLACHKVGDQGQEFAPTLDGSANRDLKHLISAIVNPNAAVEGAYGLYSVVRKDGSVAEGYMVKRDANGTTVGSPGGLKEFISRSLILFQGDQGGRSFMPEAYYQLPDQTMVDLVSYIKSLD